MKFVILGRKFVSLQLQVALLCQLIDLFHTTLLVPETLALVNLSSVISNALCYVKLDSSDMWEWQDEEYTLQKDSVNGIFLTWFCS